MKQIRMDEEDVLCRALPTSGGNPVPSSDLVDVSWAATGQPGEQPPVGLDLNWGGDPALVRVYPVKPGAGSVSFRCQGVGGFVEVSDSVEVVPAVTPDAASLDWEKTSG